jgi:O-antigen/teichoic acid export membrane protein
MLKFSLPIIPSRLAETLIKQSDKYFVLHFFSTAQLGIYSLSLKLGNTVHDLLTVPFNMAYIPRRFEIMQRVDAKNIYTKVFTYHMFLMITIGLGISLFISEILHILVTSEFFYAARYVPLVVFSMIIFGSHSHLEFGILFSKKTKYLFFINLTTSLWNLILNYFFIRNFAIWGAIVSSIITLSTQAIAYYYYSNKQLSIRFEFDRIFKILILAALVYMISTQVEFTSLWINLLLKVLLFALFLLLLFLFSIITVEEREGIKRAYTIISQKLRKKEKQINNQVTD